MKPYVVFHDYGAGEGWKIVGDYDTLTAAVDAREADVQNGGGRSEIFQHVPLLVAYREAADHLHPRPNDAQQKAAQALGLR